ncbi:MAG: SLC13 family permease [Rubripirellula sp.]|nr:SLC13 family permease [Rubripirellula sp.]
MAKQLSLFLGIITAVLVGILVYSSSGNSDQGWTAGVATLCAVWWIFEPVPIPVTSIVPLAILPLVGVLKPSEIGESYGHPLVLLMMGGFMLSMAMERSNTHRRIALGMVRIFGGGSARGLVFGFMIAAAGLSMWISNAATTLMLLPIVLVVVEKSTDVKLRTSLLLGVAYAASVGGVGTPIGTPPNLVFMTVYTETTGTEISFVQWMRMALPVVFVMIPIVGLWLTRNVNTEAVMELPKVGRWRNAEIRTLAVFVTTALLWMTRSDPFGGWSEWLGLDQANDASVALLAVVALHLIPNGEQPGEKLLDWKSAAKIPWGILILYGGGIANAKAFMASGLSDTIGASMTSLAAIPILLMIALICLGVTFLTEVTSNTATANLLMPILAAGAMTAGIDPQLVMVPAAMSCSFAFMLPVATPPNAIVFASEELTINRMAREGFVLNLVGVVVVTAICYATL